MTQNKWVDQALSDKLPALRDRGEGQDLEFKEEYPSNGYELSREIAAFASTNSGMIIIGIADDSTLVGLCNVETAAQRDELCRRIEGVCTGNVKPAITPVLKFAQENGKVVLVIEVPRGQQPLYYSKNTPYIRHHSRSRPAEPHEVIEHVQDWFQKSPLVLVQPETVSHEERASSELLSALAGSLIEVLIYGDELEDRSFDPWLEDLLHQFEFAGSRMRDMAAEDTAIEMAIDDELREVGNRLDLAANYELSSDVNSWQEFNSLVSSALESARRFKAEHIDTILLSDDSIRQLREDVRANARRLADLDSRAERMVDDTRIEEVQREASELGYALLRASHYGIDIETESSEPNLRTIGRELHLLETEQIFIDGGQSMRRVLDRLHDLNGQLQQLASQVN